MNLDGSAQTRFADLDSAGSEAQPRWQPIPNHAPEVADDTLLVSEGKAGQVAVLANDTDEESLSGDNLSITDQPSNGTATVEASSGTIGYAPSNDYLGTDQLTYRICDSFLLDQKCASAVLGITVTAAPKPAIPTIVKVGDSVTDGSTKITTDSPRPTFVGTAVADATIRVEIHSDPIILTTTAGSDGSWSVTPSQGIPPGDHTVTITATKEGSTSDPLTFVLGVTAPGSSPVTTLESIPETGADARQIRLVGVGFLATGAGLLLSRRRRQSKALPGVPPLFN